MSGLQPTPSTHSGQKTAVELYGSKLERAISDLNAGKVPEPAFLGALTELFVAQLRKLKLVSGSIDSYDALDGVRRIEIKHSKTGKKPRTHGKEFELLAWLKVEICGTRICATRLTLERRGDPHLQDQLAGPRIIFDAANPPRAESIAKESIPCVISGAPEEWPRKTPSLRTAQVLL